MNSQRIESLKKAMAQANLDALICRLPENVLFLSGYWPMFGVTFIVLPLEGETVCIFPQCYEKEVANDLWKAERVKYPFGFLDSGDLYEHIARALKKIGHGRKWKRVGYEGGFESVAPPFNAAEPSVPAANTRNLLDTVIGGDLLVDATEFLNLQRSCKTSYEVEKLRKANEIAALGLKIFCEKANVSKSGLELAADVEHAVMTQGTGYKNALRVRAFAQVATGPAETVIGCRPNEISTQRQLENQDIALLELAVVADGYWADRTCLHIAGGPTDEQLRILEIVKSAQANAIKTVRPGATAGQVDQAARSIIREAGFEKEFPHVTGHGIGFRYHEPIPLICPNSDQVLEAGMVHSVEPGIYTTQMGGMRLEDDIAVTQTGHEVLGPFENKL